ncbi:MAG: helix-turn-helix domain-containing protein [Bacillota bacterium]
MVVRGERIRELREERGYSLADFSGRAGISISYLSEIERGAKKPSLKTIEKIATALHVPKSQLVELKEESKGISLGEKMRLVREERQMSLTQFAEMVGISVSYLSEIERGNVYPSVHTLRTITDKLGVPLKALLGQGGPLGGKLRLTREEQGLTQAELAKRAGVSAGLIGQIEHGKVQPSLQTIEKVSEVLGTSPCYFILEDAGIEEMMQMMTPELRDLLMDTKVHAILRLVCNCTDDELRFILEFIKLYKREGAMQHQANN